MATRQYNIIYVVAELMEYTKKTHAGFTLIEMMLVLAIISSLTVMLVNYTTQKFDQFRRDKAELQMQQILNAALAYYASNGIWPIGSGTTLGVCPSAAEEGDQLQPTQTLQTANYLPSSVTFNNPWGNPYYLNCTTANGTNFFTVTTDVTTTRDANIVAGSLPLAYIQPATAPFDTGTFVTSQVTVPGSNLNNARSLNFGATYHNGACVPVPVCPGNMVPSILVSVASVSGVNNPPSGCSGTPPTCTSISAYPINSFTASATPPAAATVASGPSSCDGTIASQPCYSNIGNPWQVITSGTFWRVCLNVQTTNGTVNVPAETSNNSSSSIWWAAAEGTLIAITRCVPANENKGSAVNVYGN